MNIRHECPMPDLSFAVAAPLLLHLADGTTLTVRRWSLEGLWIDAEGYDLTSDIALGIPFQGVEISFPIKLAAANDAEHYTFVELTVRQRETLAVFYQGVMSGKMVPTSDIITSLDTPVDLVPMSETEEEKSAGLKKVKPRMLRILWNVLCYGFIALFLLGFVGGHIWQRVSHINLDHGRFVAPIKEYKASGTGYIEKMMVREGERVKQGDIIARLEDPDRESDVEEVRAEVLIAERRLNSARERLEQHQADLWRYRAPLLAEFERLWKPWKAHDPRAIRYPENIETAWQRLYRFDRQKDATPGGYFSILLSLQGQVEEAELDFRRWKRELRHRKSAADEFLLRAKSDGTVYRIYATKGDYVGRNDLILEIEYDTTRMAVGWLDDKMVTSVYVGMAAKVQFSFRGETKYMSGVVVDLAAGTDIAQPDKFGMVVTLKMDDAGLLTSRKLFRPNAPARIKLQRALLSGLIEGADDESS
ncbi:MAG: HlyD family efflux transporter periplasmic adaptor subunit [Pseudomonadota bacterium]